MISLHIGMQYPLMQMSLKFGTFLLIYEKMKTENVKILSVANSAFFLLDEFFAMSIKSILNKFYTAEISER